MDQSNIDEAAQFLLHLRLQRRTVTALPPELAPRSIDDGYAIQDSLHRHAGWPLQVLKVGATSTVAQEMLGVAHPIGGRVPAEGCFESGAVISRSFFAGAPLLECEFALRLDDDGRVDAIAPSFELVDRRLVNPKGVPAQSLIADNSAGAAMVLGEPIMLTDPATLDELKAQTVVLRSGDMVLVEGSGAALLGGPQASIDWTLAHEQTRSRTVAGGTWIITGSCTGMFPSEFGSSYHADFGPIGSVSFRLGA